MQRQEPTGDKQHESGLEVEGYALNLTKHRYTKLMHKAAYDHQSHHLLEDVQ
jgi:hypothetical protein